MYNPIIVPEGSTIPEDLQHLVYHGTDVIEKISASKDKQVIISINTRELQLLVEYRDLFDAEPKAIIGLQGAMYNVIWNTYVATMDRVTIDSLRAELREANDGAARAGTDAITRPSRESRAMRLRPVTRTQDPAPDESDFVSE